jgi:hypothetical protein
MIKACGVCKEIYNIDLLETHHKIPRSLKGSDDPSNLIDLCAICHTSIHTLARLLKKDPGKAAAFLYDNYGDDLETHKFITQLAKVIIYEGENVDQKEDVLVFIKMPFATHQMLSDLSKGCRVSMEKYILSLIEKEGRRSQERGQFILRKKL